MRATTLPISAIGIFGTHNNGLELHDVFLIETFAHACSYLSQVFAQSHPQQFRLDYSKRNENSGDSFDADLLQERLQNLRLEIMEEEMKRNEDNE